MSDTTVNAIVIAGLIVSIIVASLYLKLTERNR